jgi:hypothetical protein
MLNFCWQLFCLPALLSTCSTSEGLWVCSKDAADRLELESCFSAHIPSRGGVGLALSAVAALGSVGAVCRRQFPYIAASDLVPETKAQDSLPQALSSFAWFSAGLLALWMLASA